MEEIIPTVGILVFKDDQVLLVRHEAGAGHLTGTYGLPAGRIEAGEEDIDSAIRELYEEAGLKTDEESMEEYPGNRYEGRIKRKDGNYKIFPYHIFICRKYTGELRESDESTPEWINVGQVNKLNLLVNVEKIINDGLKYK